MTDAEKVILWDAINEYTQACGGDTSNATISTRRMNAVAAMERVIRPSPEDTMYEGAVSIAEHQQHRADEAELLFKSLTKRHDAVVQALQRAHSWIGGVSYVGSKEFEDEAEAIIDMMGNTIYEECTAQAYADLAASGGIVDAP